MAVADDFDFSQTAAPAAGPRSNAFVSGLKSGALGAAGSIEGAVAAGAQLAGFGNNTRFADAAQGFNMAAQAASRPDIEQNGWFGGGLSGFGSKLAYSAGQFIPQAVGYGAAAAGVAAALPEAAAGVGGGLLVRAGMAVPEFLGGAGGAVGEAAEATGSAFAKNLIAGGMPLAAASVGDIYNDANQRPGGATYADALKAVALGVPTGAIQAIGPRGADGIVKSGLAHAGAFAVGSGLQEAAITTNDPNMSAGDRAKSIVEAAASGAVFGGLLGAGHAFMPSHAPTEALTQTVDQQLGRSSGIDNMQGMGFEPGQQPTGQPFEQRPQLEPHQPDLPLPPIYRGAEAYNEGGQGNLLEPSSLGNAAAARSQSLMDYLTWRETGQIPPDRPAPMQGPELDPLFKARLERLGITSPDVGMASGDPTQAGVPGPDLAALASSMAESRARRAAPPEAPEAQVTPAQDDLLRQQMGAEAPDQTASRMDMLDNAMKVAQAQGNDAQVKAIMSVKQSLTDQARQMTDAQLDEAGPAQGENAPRTVAQQEDDAARQRDLARLRTMAPDAAARRGLTDDVPQPAPSTADAARADLFKQFGDDGDAIKSGTMMRDWLDSSKVTSAPELYNALEDELTNKSKLSRTAAFRNMAEQIGLLGEDKKPFDVTAERQEAMEMPNEQARNARLTEIDHVERMQTEAAALREPVEPRVTGPVDQPADTPADTPANRPADTPAAPKSIADRVMDAAHDLTGGTGGEAKIADIRARLPDVASGDLDNALRQIHGDDTDNTLTQAPKGERKGVDGVSVRDQGRFHNLSVEPRDDLQGKVMAAAKPNTGLGGDRIAMLDTAKLGDALRAEGTDRTVSDNARVDRAEQALKSLQPGEDYIAPHLGVGDDHIGFDDGRHRFAAMERQGFDRVPISMDAQSEANARKRGLIAGDRDAVQERSAKAVDAREPAGPVQGDGGGNAATGETAGAQPVQERAQVGEAPRPAEAQAAVKSTEPYPGASEAAKRLGVREPERPVGPQAKGFDDKLQQLWSRAQKGDFGYDYAQTWRQADEYARQEQVTATNKPQATRQPVTPTGQPIDIGAAFAARQRLTAGVDEKGATSLAPETIGATDAEAAEGMAIPPEQVLPRPEAPVTLKLPTNDTPIDDVRPSAPATPADLAAHLKEITGNLKGDVQSRISMIDDASKLPQRVKDAAVRQGLDLSGQQYRVPALAHDGSVYLFKNEIQSKAELESLISHEVIGHLGTRAQTGGGVDTYTSMLSKIFDRAGGRDGLLNLMDKYKMRDDLNRYRWFQPENLDKPMSDYDKAQAVDEFFAHAAESTVFSRAQRGALAVLGKIKQTMASMFDSAGLHEFAERFKTFDTADVEKWLADSRGLLEDPQPPNTIDLGSLPGIRQDVLRLRTQNDQPLLSKLSSIRDQNGVVGDILRATTALSEKVGASRLSNLKGKALSLIDNVKQSNDMVRDWGRDVPGMVKDYHANELGTNITAATRQTTNVVERYLTRLAHDDPRLMERVSAVMQNASSLGYDPFARWETQTHLRDNPNREAIQEQHAKDFAEVNTWNQPLTSSIRGLFRPTEKNLEPGALTQVYKSVADAGAFTRNLQNINRLHATSEMMGLEIPGFETHATQDYVNQRQLQGDVAGSRAYSRTELDKLITATDAHLQSAEPGVARDAMTKLVDSIKGELSDQDRNIPYVHFGRDGDHFVSMTLGENEAGTGADPAKAQKLQDWLNANNMGDVRVNTVQSNRDVMIRMDTEGARKKLANAIMSGELKDITDPSVEPRNGVIESSKTEQPDLLPVVAQLRDRLSKEFGADQKASILQTINHVMLDMAPQDSSLGVNAQRMNVRGQSADLLKNFQHSNAIALNALGHGAVMVDRANADAAMVKQRHDMTVSSHPQNARVTDLSRAIDSYRARNDAQGARVQSSFIGTMRNAAHAFYLAGSPGYVIMQVAQPYTLTMPELAKSFSFGGSLKALTGTLPEVAKLMRAMSSVHADILRGKGDTFATGVTEEALRRYVAAGGDKGTAAFLSKLDSMGKLESGSMSYDNLADGNKHVAMGIAKKAYQTAVSTATYAELGGRLAAGLAAKKLYDAAPEKARGFATAEDYAAHVVSQSMMEWGGAARSRLASAGGPLGPVAPAMFQFHGFGTQLFFKLMNESYNAIKGDTAEDRAEARRFMAGHLAASMTLAGSLGLPFAGWAAAAATKASTMLPGSGGEAYDVDAHYRDFLASILGNKLGEVVAHGLPRFVNTDFSDLGDKDLLPMQSFLEDRRKLEESIPDYLSKAWGSSFGIGAGALMGVRDLSEGRIMPGLSRFMPTALRNFAKAYQIDEHGYLNSQGEKMPISTDASDVLKQALGIRGGAQAEEEERSNTAIGAKDDRTYHGGLIKQQIARAIESGDQAGVQQWMDEMRKYDANPSHAGQPIAPTLQSYLAARQKAVQYSQATKLPLGVTAHDIATQALMNY